MTDIPITMLAPCQDCIHEKVCAIKAVVDAEKATLRIPALMWITPRSDFMVVDCSEFIDVLNVRPVDKRRTRSGHIARPSDRLAPKGHGRRAVSNDDLVAFYETHSGNETAEHFHLSRATVSRRIGEIQAAGGTVIRHARGGRRPAAVVVEPAKDDWAPLCMSADDFGGWKSLNARILTLGDRAKRPCEDCPVAYAEEMRAKSMCNGEPGVAA